MTDIPTLTHHTHMMDGRLRAVEDQIDQYKSIAQRHQNLMRSHEDALQVLSGYREMSKRFDEIERFMKYLLDYFDPTPKMKKEIAKLQKQVKDKDEEIEKTRSILKEALK